MPIVANSDLQQFLGEIYQNLVSALVFPAL